MSFQSTATVERHNPWFVTTRWTVVLAAREKDSAQADDALEKLCHTYWQPIYAYVRRQGHNPHNAQDLTQEFFARLLEKRSLAGADQQKGRFRSFLLVSLKHFLANEWDKTQTQRRGGGRTIISIDEKLAESSCGFDLPDALTAEKLFERRWAMTLLEITLSRLRAEYVADGKGLFFENVKGTLTGERSSLPYAELAAKLGTSEGNIKVAVHRLRQRYRELLRAEIANTVSSHDDVEDELRNLFVTFA